MSNKYYRPTVCLTAEQMRGPEPAKLAAALLLGVGVSDSVYGNIGKRTQVRCVNPSIRSLRVKQTDLYKYGTNVPFVLIKQNGPRFTIIGWMLGREAKKMGKWTDGGRPDRPPMWLVEDYLLHPITQLENP